MTFFSISIQFRSILLGLTLALYGICAVFLFWFLQRRVFFATVDMKASPTSHIPISSTEEIQKRMIDRVINKLFADFSVDDVVIGRTKVLRDTIAFAGAYFLAIAISLILEIFQSLLSLITSPGSVVTLSMSRFSGVLIGAVFLLILVMLNYLWFYVGSVMYIESKEQHTDDHCPALTGLIEAARLELPRRCHLGDSNNITVTAFSDSGTKFNYLEVELMAAGMDISGDSKQRQRLDRPVLTFEWNVNFSKAGTHVYNILFRELDGLGQVIQHIETKKYTARVVTLYRQYGPSLVIAVVTIITLLYTMRGDLSSLLQGLGV